MEFEPGSSSRQLLQVASWPQPGARTHTCLRVFDWNREIGITV